MAPTRRSLLVAAQVAALALVLYLVARDISGQWREVGPAIRSLDPNWPSLLASAVLVLATYLLLVQLWRATIRIWGGHLRFADAARIWFVSNLGKYLPGKVWQLVAMGEMAQRRGVSRTAAIGTSLVLNLVNVLAGFAVLAASGTAALEASGTGAGASTRTVLGLIAGAGLLALASAPWVLPPLADLARRVTGRDVRVPELPATVVWLAAGGTLLAWVAYGLAFRLFCTALLGPSAGAAGAYITVYTVSYLAGYLALFAVGGLGVREAVLVLAMPRMGLATTAEAAVIAVASRIWLTILEVLPGLLFLARREGDAGGERT